MPELNSIADRSGQIPGLPGLINQKKSKSDNYENYQNNFTYDAGFNDNRRGICPGI
jgi:hypothetical protein